jgi:hypothetical protein
MHRLVVASLVVLVGCQSKNDDNNTDSAAREHNSDDDSGHMDQDDTDPPDDFDASRTVTSNDGLFTAVYVPTPDPIPESIEFSVAVTITDPTDPNLALSDVVITSIDATMPSHGGHGMNVNPVVSDNDDGTGEGSPLKFHMPGYWMLHVEATVGGQSDRADFEIDCCE